MSEQTTQEQIVEMDINLLRTFKDHPFKVTADYPMIQLKESIENCGILTPLLVRPLKDGSYACSPEDSSFKAVFTDMKLTECQWKAHDGQKPDEM